MRVLILAPQPFFQNRGTPIAVRMLAQDLQGAGNSVELLVYHEGEDVDLDGITLHRTAAFPGVKNIPPGFSWKKIICDCAMLWSAIRLCSSTKYDVIHAVEESVFIALLLKRIFRISYIYDVDSWLSDQLIEKFSWLRMLKNFFFFFEKRAVKGCSGSVVVCRALEEKILAIDAAKPLLRLEDVSMLQYDQKLSSESLNRLTGDDGITLLYVGNLEGYQGIEFLLDAFRVVAEKRDDVKLVIIGGSPEGIKKYSVLSEELAIDRRVFFIGPRPVEHLALYLQQADLLLSPRMDGVNTPMKIYSYMGSGIPVVATRILSHTQVLDDTTALLAEVDAADFAATILRGLEDKKYSDGLGAAAKALVEREYSRESFRKKITDFYSKYSHVWNLRD